MKYDLSIIQQDLEGAVKLAVEAEAIGFDAFWTAETAHNPFFPLTLASSQTERIGLGTQIAVAFPRSPMVIAQIAWDLQKQSEGRFKLGLGTQVQAHIEKRFGMKWQTPIRQMREYVESVRAIWDTFQNDARLRYKGEHYTFRLMAPFFNPGPIEHPDIPIYIAGVNEHMCQLAGSHCDGLHAHAFHSVRYLKEIVEKNIEIGLATTDKKRSEFELVVPVFIACGEDQQALDEAIREVKSRIAFYASTPAYRVLMQLHGWDTEAKILSGMARDGEWEQMWKKIDDSTLEEIAIVGTPQEVMPMLKKRYEGLADRVCIGWEKDEAAPSELWKQFMTYRKGNINE
ncbi:LLM class F420-dependent oxidoreductase [Anaerolineales bacterium]